MNQLPALLALLLSASALAGEGGPHPVHPLASGQIWQLNATDKYGLNVSLEMQLSNTIPEDVLNATAIYSVNSILGGGNINFIPREGGIDASIVLSKDGIIRCFALADTSNNSAAGYFLLGTVEATNQALMTAQQGDDFSRQALLHRIRKVGWGSCTLKRLR